MKKENENKKTEFSISKINNIIGKLNKTGILLIVVIYIAILGVALSLVGKDINYINEPAYNHIFYDKEITPQISMVGVRNFEDGHQTLKYNISVNISGRLINSVDPGYKISNFRMFANTKSNLKDKDVSSTYYFTEHTSYKTQVTHSFTVDNSEKGQHPSEFFVRLQYENGGTKVSTFREKVFLQPTPVDIDEMNSFYDQMEEAGKKQSYAGIQTNNGAQIGSFQVASYKETGEDGKETGIYKTGVRIDLSDLPETTKKFHVDMQSWIVSVDPETNEETYLPFIGVYNYTGHSKKYTNSYSNIDKKLHPAYIAAKVVYTDETFSTKDVTTIDEMGSKTFYFKQAMDDLDETFHTKIEKDEFNSGTVSNNNRVLYIVLAASITAVGAVLVIVVTYFIVKKKSKKETVVEEENNENNNEENLE